MEKKATCSGMTRAFAALMDAADVKAYWIHGATNDHQWNIVDVPAFGIADHNSLELCMKYK